MMNKYKLVSFGLAISLAYTTSYAASMRSLLDGMFTNVTAPDVVTSQFRGTIAGGGMYVRAPISNAQIFTIDPPRLSIGCGGIDLYMGSFSFITAAKLTQFIRNIAQNAAPLAFKLALDNYMPSLGRVLETFQTLAQSMNNHQMNSCQLAHGIMDGSKNPTDVFNNLSTMVSQGNDVLTGMAKDFTAAYDSGQLDPTKPAQRVQDSKNPDGSKAFPDDGNITWNALNAKSNQGYTYTLTDDPVMAQQLILSLIGTSIKKPGRNPGADPIYAPIEPTLRLKQLFEPTTDTDNSLTVPILSCSGDILLCLTPNSTTFKTTGIRGYVLAQMFGDENINDASQATNTSIVGHMMHCTTGNCSLSQSQINFLNAVGKVPVIGLLMRAQGSPQLIGAVAYRLIDELVNEISLVYGESVYQMAISTFSNTSITPPTDYGKHISEMRNDLREVSIRSASNHERLNAETTFIDSVIRANGSAIRYRPQ